MPPKKKPLVQQTLDFQKDEKMDCEADSSQWNWINHDTLIFGNAETKGSEKIASFDMDDTLIKTKSGAKFATSAKDWQWWDPSVPQTLQKYHNLGYKIVIFTNQKGISTGNTQAATVKSKVQDIQKQAKIPIQCLMATSDDQYRKPCLGMWEYMVNKQNDNIKVDMANSFYCGDAAGRNPPKGKGKKDFTDTDYKFALNLELKFYTPEMYFLGSKEELPKPSFNPKTIAKSGSLFKGENVDKVEPQSKEMIIFVGSVGSGKSTFWKNHLSTYIRINRDTLKTKEKCISAAKDAINKGLSCVIDNQNTKKDDRKPFIDLAKENNYSLRAFFFESTKDLCMHNDGQREVNANRKHLSDKVGKIPIHTFFKYLEMPTKAEGFSDVKTVNFVAGPFENKKDEETFFSFGK